MRAALAVLLLAACSDPTPEERLLDAYHKANEPAPCQYPWTELYFAGSPVTWQDCAQVCTRYVEPRAVDGCGSPYVVTVDGFDGACGAYDEPAGVWHVRWLPCGTAL